MKRHEFLHGLHDRLSPRSYLEIGVNDGRSLALSRTRTIGVDPAFKVTVDLACDLQLLKATSDDFFAAPDPLGWFPERTPDLTFIDGMHLFEFAFRDFINSERHARPSGVIVLDDMLPRSVAEAARNRYTNSWTGDVYKVASVLEQYRPDLTVVPLDTAPTGLVLVVGLDPDNTTLTDRYDAILADNVTDDPQAVPSDVLHRRQAADAAKVLASDIWDEVIASRASGAPLSATGCAALAALRGTADYTLDPPVPEPWPTPKKTGPKKAGAKKVPARPPSAWSRLRRSRAR